MEGQLPAADTGQSPSAGRAHELLLAAVALLLFGTACTAGDDLKGWAEVGPEERIVAQGVTWVAEAHAFVVGSSDGLIALSSDAQHLEGERLLYCIAREVFIGPHGELFDKTGAYVTGPASSDMDRLPLAVVDRIVRVDPDHPMATPTRSQGTPGPAGEGCTGHEEPPGFVRTD